MSSSSAPSAPAASPVIAPQPSVAPSTPDSGSAPAQVITAPPPQPVANPAAPSAAPDLSFKPTAGDTPVAPIPPLIKNPATKAPSPKSAQPSAAAPVKSSAQTADIPPYVLGANDVVQVAVFGVGEVSGTYAIGPDGRISIPLIHDFRALGLTCPELQDVIEKKLGDFINDPVVNVQLLRSNSKKYTLIGGVGRTGPVPLTQQTTVLDALAAAGGFKDFSKPTKIIIWRGTKKFYFNYKQVIKGEHMEQNITLEDGDLIIVPE